MIFSKAEIAEIRERLSQDAVKDTQFPSTEQLKGTDTIAIVQDGVNKKIPASIILDEVKHPYISLERIRTYLYRVTFDSLPEDSEIDSLVLGGCSSYVKDGKLYRNLDFNYDHAASFIVRTNSFEGMSFVTGLNAGNMDDKLIAQLPYRVVDGINNYGIKVSTHVLFNDWDWNGCGAKSISLTKLPFLILTKAKSINTLQTDLSGILSNLYASEGIKELGYLIQILVTDGTRTCAILPPTSDGESYVIQNITSNPKLSNFRWVNRETVVRTEGDIQLRPTGVERFNAMPCELKDLRFTKAYEEPSRLSEFIGLRETTKSSTDQQLLAIYNTAHDIYIHRERDGQTWHTMHSVVYANRMEELYIQEDWDDNCISGIIDLSEYAKKTEVEEGIRDAKEHADDVAEAAYEAGKKDLQEATEVLVGITERIDERLTQVDEELTGKLEIANEKISEAEGHIEDAKCEIENAKIRIDVAEGDISTAKIDIDEAKGEISAHAERLDIAEGTITNVGIRVDAAEGQIISQGHEIDTINEQVSDVNLTLDAHDARITQTASRVDVQEGRVTQAELDINGANARIDLQAENIETLTGRVSFAEIAIDGAGARIDLLAEDVRTTEGQVSSLGLRADAAEGTITTFNNWKDTATGQLTVMEEKWDNIDATIITTVATEMQTSGSAIKTGVETVVDGKAGSIVTTAVQTVATEIDGILEVSSNFSQVKQDTTQLKVTVGDATNGLVHDVSVLNQTSTQIAARVTSTEDALSDGEGGLLNVGEIKVTADETSMSVTRGDNYAAIIARINSQTGESQVMLSADKIYLLGETVAEKLTALHATIGNLTLNNALVHGTIESIVNDVVMWQLKNDGTGSLAKGNITWNANGDASFTGGITATSLSLGSGVKIDYDSHIDNKPDLTVYIAKDGTIGSTPSEGATGFVVSSAGLLKASNAIIYGTLYSHDGQIGGWTIGQSKLSSGDISIQGHTSTADGCIQSLSDNTTHWKFNEDGSGLLANNNVYWDEDGNFTIAGNATILGGTIGGWTIDEDKIYSGTVVLDNDGNIINKATDQTYPYWHLDSNGAGGIAKNNIHWDEHGVIYFPQNVVINSDTVDLRLISKLSYFLAAFKPYNSNNQEIDWSSPAAQIAYIKTPYNFCSDSEITAGGVGSDTPVATTTLGGLLNVVDAADDIQSVDKILVRLANASGGNSWTLADLSSISGTVVGVKMNGVVKNPGTDKVVDLGTVITEHQSLAGYQPLIDASHKLAYSLISETPTSLPASDVYDWAKAETKPSYAFSEITGTASTGQIPTLAISKISGLQTALDGKYVKPTTGIPATDLATAVQTSLGLADSAYQKPSTGIPYADLASGVQTALDKAHEHANKTSVLDKLKWDADNNAIYIGDEDNPISFYAYGEVTAGGVGSGGGGGVNYLYMLEDVPDYRTSYRGKYLRAKSDGSGVEWVDVTGGVSSVINLTGDITQAQLRTALGLGSLAYVNSLGWANLTNNANSLEEGTSDVTDNTELLTSYASDNGFSDPNAVGKVYKRDAIKVYNYVKNKLGLGSLAYLNGLSKGDVGLGNVDNTADAYKSVASANVLTTYVANGSDNLSCLKNIFSSIPKSVGTAVRLQHSSHSMALGWFLSGYDYEHAYGGWFISDYGTPSWVGVDNGNWKVKNFAFTSDIPTNNNQLTNGAGYITSSGSCAYATSAGNADTLDGQHASYFQPASTAITTGNIASQKVAALLYNYYGSGLASIPYSGSEAQYGIVAGGTDTALDAYSQYTFIQLPWVNDSFGGRLLFGINSGKIGFQTKHSGTWTELKELYHSGNCNNASTPWSCSNLTLGGTLTTPSWAITSDGNLQLQIANDNLGILPKQHNYSQIGSSSLYWFRCYIYDGYFSHNITAGGNIVASGEVTAGSDARWKHDIRPVLNGIDAIMKLQPSEWEWNSDNHKGSGLVAQQTMEVLPHLVKEDSEGYLHLTYDGLHAYEISAIQHHETEIDRLRKRVAYLENQLNINA